MIRYGILVKDHTLLEITEGMAILCKESKCPTLFFLESGSEFWEYVLPPNKEHFALPTARTTVLKEA